MLSESGLDAPVARSAAKNAVVMTTAIARVTARDDAFARAARRRRRLAACKTLGTAERTPITEGVVVKEGFDAGGLEPS